MDAMPGQPGAAVAPPQLGVSGVATGGAGCGFPPGAGLYGPALSIWAPRRNPPAPSTPSVWAPKTKPPAPASRPAGADRVRPDDAPSISAPLVATSHASSNFGAAGGGGALPATTSPLRLPSVETPARGKVHKEQQAAQSLPIRGAAGQAAVFAEGGVLQEVRTWDSVSNYATQAATLAAPDAHASAPERMDHLEAQLDSLLGKHVHGTLRVLRGHHNRLAGGQAVVQIVEDTSSSDHEKYAIKFFLHAGAFHHEKKLYVDATQPLGRFLPKLHSIAEGEQHGLRDAQGGLMPPCIIMEKGEALDAWIQKSNVAIDFFSGLQVLSHIADRLIDLHSAGYVHRDIKPGNIMWLPRTKRWTLIDFGCAARIGTHACTGYSLLYGAPEALKAHLDGQEGLLATEALDAWSLGVLAMELLTGTPVFERTRPREEVSGMIMVDRQAPWEDSRTAKALLQPLGIFKRAVLQLVRRDEAQRSTIQHFKQSIESVVCRIENPYDVDAPYGPACLV